jgi:hypothetical protein
MPLNELAQMTWQSMGLIAVCAIMGFGIVWSIGGKKK